MRKTLMLSTALGAALLLAAPASAQHTYTYGFQPPPGTPLEGGEPRDRGLIPPVAQQYQAARQAQDTENIQQMLRQAQSALERNNFGLANEYLERAETSVLNRRFTMRQGGMDPRDSDTAEAISEARRALWNRDIDRARRATQIAIADAQAMGRMAERGPGWGQQAGPGWGQQQQWGQQQWGQQPWGQQAAPGWSQQQWGQQPGWQAQGGWGTPGGFTQYGPSGGTREMPSQVMPGTSQFPNVQGQIAMPRGAPPPGQPFAGASEQDPMSRWGQVRPGDPTLGGRAGGPDTLGGGPGGAAGGSQ
jgi:hypothetical protein